MERIWGKFYTPPRKQLHDGCFVAFWVWCLSVTNYIFSLGLFPLKYGQVKTKNTTACSPPRHPKNPFSKKKEVKKANPPPPRKRLNNPLVQLTPLCSKSLKSRVHWDRWPCFPFWLYTPRTPRTDPLAKCSFKRTSKTSVTPQFQKMKLLFQYYMSKCRQRRWSVKDRDDMAPAPTGFTFSNKIQHLSLGHQITSLLN